jgi:hypothetical protein
VEICTGREGGLDTWCSFATAHQVEACCINDARLAPPGQIHLKCHLKKHKCRVDAMLVELEQLTKVVQTFLSCNVLLNTCIETSWSYELRL